MDLTELSNLGDFVGGVGVLITLVYLAIQVRQTKEFVRMESAKSTVKDYTAFLFQMMDADHMKLFRQGMKDFESLPKNDQARLHAWLFSVLMTGQYTYALGEQGAADEGMRKIVDIPNAAILRCPGTAKWWSAAKKVFANDFVRHMENQIELQADAPFFYESLPWYAWDEDDNAKPKIE